jgi:hypothetical protein
MLDWPEATHTSPTRTSRTTTLSVPARTTSRCGPGAVCGGSTTRHAPEASAVAPRDVDANVTVTDRRGALHPHTGSRA